MRRQGRGAAAGTARRLLLLAAALFALLLVDWAIVRGGLAAHADARLLLLFRTRARPDLAAVPGWLDLLLRDVTVLGAGRLLALVTIGASGLFIVRRATGSAVLFVLAVYAGTTLERLLKLLVHRTRPDVVPHFAVEPSFSFPSAHSANSALVFLMLAGLAARREPDAATRRYIMGAAIATTLLIGVSRVYLGVHWPSDVVAGWCFGAGWAALWLALAERVLPTRGAQRGPAG